LRRKSKSHKNFWLGSLIWKGKFWTTGTTSTQNYKVSTRLEHTHQKVSQSSRVRQTHRYHKNILIRIATHKDQIKSDTQTTRRIKAGITASPTMVNLQS